MPIWTKFFITILLVIIAFLIREPLGLGERLTYVTFNPVITVASIVFGVWPGVLSLILSSVIVVYFIIGIDNALVPYHFNSFILYFLLNIFIIYLGRELNMYHIKVRLREEELKKAELKVQEQTDLLDLAHDYIIVRDMYGRIMYMNPSAEKAYGWTKEQAYGKVIHALLETQFPTSFEDYYKTLIEIGKWEGELIHTTSSGEKVVVQSSQTVKYDKNNNPIAKLEINRDITETKRTEKEILRLSQLDIIGEMAAGIGHEVRNPMTTVRGYLQMFRKKEQFAEYGNQLDTMIEELDRANSIITEYLSLAKDKRADLKLGNLNGTLHALFPLLQAEAFRTGHELQADMVDIHTILYDEQEVRQMILNLVRNAFEAMIKGGKVTIRTYNLANDNVVLSIQDTGSGIPREIIAKIGTPFFTTKDNGTGLGLSVCYRIAEKHNARITIESNEGEGTTISITFPKAMEE